MKRIITNISLLIANIITIYVVMSGSWGFSEVILIYWAQAAIIGVFTFKKLRFIEEFKKTLRGKENNKGFGSSFFAMHYGAFFFVYFIFIAGLIRPEAFLASMISIILFYINHLISYEVYKEKLKLPTINTDTIATTPYLRIIPMHFIIMVGGFFFGFDNTSRSVIIVFMLLKTAIDLTLHNVEHKQIIEKRNV